MKECVLVTGCAGFIGSHLCERLLENGHQVIGIDNFDPFYARETKESNLSGFLNSPHFSFHETDITDPSFYSAFADRDVSAVIHLAGKAGVRPSIDNPQAYIDNNISGTLHVLQYMRERQVSHLVFGSSSSIYGNGNETPYQESAMVDSPISPYAQTKRSCELLNHTYHALYSMNVLNLRFFTVYGPRQRPDLAIHKFARLMSEGQPIPMFGEGDTLRDYTYIDDIVQGILLGLHHVLSNKGVCETVNLGNNSPIRLSDLLTVMEDVSGMPAHVTRMPKQPGDVDMTCASTEKAQKLLGYAPSTPLKVGIRKFYRWFEGHQQEGLHRTTGAALPENSI